MAKEKENTFEENLEKLCDDKLKNAEEKVNSILNKDGKLEEFNIEE